MTRSPVAVLIHWEQNGATWRLHHRSDCLVVIDLYTCHGEPVDELRSSDAELLRYVARRVASTDKVE